MASLTSAADPSAAEIAKTALLHWELSTAGARGWVTAQRLLPYPLPMTGLSNCHHFLQPQLLFSILYV